MNCCIDRELAEYQRALDQEAAFDSAIEREAKRLSKMPVADVIRDAPDDIGQELDSLIGLLAGRYVERDSECPEPSDADDCRQLMALRSLRYPKYR